jgi:hypothetical protein
MYKHVNEWLLFIAKWVLFKLYRGENNLHFDDIMSVLDQHA